jgi:ABC-type branched-subunit amino acid transport system ATPase component
MQPALAQLPASTRAVVAADLSGLEQDWLSIEAALAADPDNLLLLELRQTAESRAESVREQVNRVAASVSEAIDI